MAIRTDKTKRVPAVLLTIAVQASQDYDEDSNRDTVGTYTEERCARILWTVLRELREHPEILEKVNNHG